MLPLPACDTINMEVLDMAYVDFPEGLEGQKKRKAFWLSEDGRTLIAGWRRNGIPMAKIIKEYIGVSNTGFWGWYRESEELRKSCTISKEASDAAVEGSLLKRALGYDYVEQTYDLIEGELRLSHEYHRHMPPDTKAILAWLYNRLPGSWRSVQEPLTDTQYNDTIKNILVAMKEVSDTGTAKRIEVSEAKEDASPAEDGPTPAEE